MRLYGDLMDILSWLELYGSVLSLIASIILVIVTGIYVYFTKKILDSSIRQSNLVSNPVIGILLDKMVISKAFGPRRQLNIGINLANVGNAPAIEVLVDAEIEFLYATSDKENIIPARFEPYSIPFIRPGEEITEDVSHNPNFGNSCLKLLFEDQSECSRLNINRIATNPQKEPYNPSILRVCIYYRNNLGQYFESIYEIHFNVGDPVKKAGKSIDFIPPADNETCNLYPQYIPRPKFHSGPIKREDVEKNLKIRDSKRKLSGW